MHTHTHTHTHTHPHTHLSIPPLNTHTHARTCTHLTDNTHNKQYNPPPLWAHALRERERWGGGGGGRTETDLYHTGEGNLSTLSSVIIDHLSSSSPPLPDHKRLIIRNGEEKSHYRPVHTCNINYYSFTPSRPAAQLPRSFTYEGFPS